jgi:hypothetical protein
MKTLIYCVALNLLTQLATVPMALFLQERESNVTQMMTVLAMMEPP